ncbi:trichohyalin-like [Procambarus clarkii]|uniref:trichohyalin-like n=1 Tax=Procambarus clarkii TaxID=6728 RepID=UPI003744A050
MRTLMRDGDHAFIMQDLVIKYLMGVDVSQTGNCDFYVSDERFLSSLMSVIAQKNNPFLQAINARIQRVTEAGLYSRWLQEATPNATTCLDQPAFIQVDEPIRIANIWGLFVVLASGLAVSSIVFCLEVVTARHSSSRRAAGRASFSDDFRLQTFRKQGLHSKTFRKQQGLHQVAFNKQGILQQGFRQQELRRQGARQQELRRQGARQQELRRQGARQQELRRQGARQQAFHQHLARIQAFRQSINQRAIRPQDIPQHEFHQESGREEVLPQQDRRHQGHIQEAFLEEIFTAAVASSFPLPTPPEEQDVINLMF